MSEQTGLRLVRRRLLAGMVAGMGVLGAGTLAPLMLRPARAAAQSDADASDDRAPAALYDGDQSDPTGRKFAGLVHWELVETANYGENLLVTSLRASVAIPDQKMALAWRLERNRDKTLPASHLVVLQFTLPPDARRDIDSVSGLLTRSSRQARAVPLAGLAVKVVDRYFLFGLSDKYDAEAANLALLEKSEWFDVPIVFSDGHRAMLTFEKGEPGRRLLAQAFAAWDGPPRPPPPLPTIK